MRLNLEDNKPSVLGFFVRDDEQPREKMSKSRGNCVTVDMVVYGVMYLEVGYEFRDAENRVIKNWKQCGIWRNKSGDGFYYTGPAFGERPVFLCKIDEIIPARLLLNEVEVMQHPDLINFRDVFYNKFPDEFRDTGEVSYYVREPSDYERAGVYGNLDA